MLSVCFFCVWLFVSYVCLFVAFICLLPLFVCFFIESICLPHFFFVEFVCFICSTFEVYICLFVYHLCLFLIESLRLKFGWNWNWFAHHSPFKKLNLHELLAPFLRRDDWWNAARLLQQPTTSPNSIHHDLQLLLLL